MNEPVYCPACIAIEMKPVFEENSEEDFIGFICPSCGELFLENDDDEDARRYFCFTD